MKWEVRVESERGRKRLGSDYAQECKAVKAMY